MMFESRSAVSGSFEMTKTSRAATAAVILVFFHWPPFQVQSFHFTMAEEVSIEDLLVNEYSTIDKILEIGLYIGAVFQLVCIGAIFFLKSPDDEEEEELEKNGVNRVFS